jgi:5-hydroxyisourate hydrolase-like protein (transthyretin family)
MRRGAICGLLAGVVAGSLEGAAIRGTVVEKQSGHPLENVAVALEAAGGGRQPLQARTNSYGAFEFTGLAAGEYMVSAARLAFAAVQYGQKRWNSAGAPVRVEDREVAEVAIRMPRLAAITGTILDENDVGLPDHDVAVYTNTRPPKLLGRAKTDDRGMYRIWGLPPGSYLVRSLSKIYDDGGYLPTFFRDSATVEESRRVEVKLDEQADGIDIRAAPGLLFKVAGRLVWAPSGQTSVAISSDAGTEYSSADSGGNFSFTPMAPGQYEMLTVGTDHGRTAAAFQSLTVDRDLTEIRVGLMPLPTLQVGFEDRQGRPMDGSRWKVVARRKDIAGDMKGDTVQLAGRTALLPGRWEVAMEPAAEYCVVGFRAPQAAVTDRGRTEGWNDVVLAAGSENAARFVLSSTPGRLSGMVKNAAGEAAAGVPVFLEAFDLDPRKRVTATRSTVTNGQGLYQFGGLAAGVYRVLATYEYQAPDSAEMESAQAQTVKVEEGSKTVLDVEQFVIR